ncbi:MAG: guanylate kinase [bacterium]
MKGMLFVLSGPSGAGKTTVCRTLQNDYPGLKYIISATSRKPRGYEKNGHDYFFISNQEFKQKIANGYFLEWAEVHGHLYGTPKNQVIENYQQGHISIMDIDIQGAMNLKKQFPQAITAFIMPPTWEEMVKRLDKRATESQNDLQQRMENAKHELNYLKYYDYLVINSVVNQAVEQLKSIINAEKCKIKNLDLEEALPWVKKITALE